MVHALRFSVWKGKKYAIPVISTEETGQSILSYNHEIYEGVTAQLNFKVAVIYNFSVGSGLASKHALICLQVQKATIQLPV